MPSGQSTVGRDQLAQVFKDPRTLRAMELALQTTAQAQAGGLFNSGDLKAFAGPVAPDGWLACNGAAVSRTVYAGLFTAIGTAWGPGDGATTFNIPDFRDRTLLGASGTRALGSTGGADSVSLSVGQLPAHDHPLTDPGHNHAVTDPGHDHTIPVGGASAGGAGASAGVDSASTTGNATTGLTVNTATTGATVGNTGSGDPVPTLSPYGAVTWLIKI